MKILTLTIKCKWFDMIASGEKKEEYREIKHYWTRRLMFGFILPLPFTHVLFRNGYRPDSPTLLIECKGIDVGPAVPEWSDNWKGDVFRIKLGEIIKKP